MFAARKNGVPRAGRRIARCVVPCALLMALCAAVNVAAQLRGLDDVLTRVGERVEEYYRHAQSIVCLETVRVQPLGNDMAPDGRARVLQYELRVSWESAPDDNTPPEATVLRELITVDGRPPRVDAKAECMDPHAVSPEPLAMLLRGHRDEYLFSPAGTRRTKGRQTVLLDYKSRTVGKPEVTWRGECFSVSLPGRTKGRIWVDEATNDVLRLDESLTGFFEYQLPRERVKFGTPMAIQIERADSSIRYRAVVFRDPDEEVMVPDTIESLQIVRGSGVPRVRTTQTFSNYRRFVTGARLVD